MVQRQHYLHQRSNPCCRFQMSKICLHRTDGETLIPGPTFAQYLVKCKNFYRITQRCSRTMSFYILNIQRIHTTIFQCLSNYRFLRGSIWGGKSIAAPIMIYRRASNHCKDPVTICNSIRQALEYHNSAPFTTHIAISMCIKGLTSSIRSHSLQFAEANCDFR